MTATHTVNSVPNPVASTSVNSVLALMSSSTSPPVSVPSAVRSDQTVLDPAVPPFRASGPPRNPSAHQNARRGKAKDAIKDPKDVENEFLKKELNIVKLHLLEQEAEVKDLKRKNKVLSETLSIFENGKQSGLSNQFPTTSVSLSSSSGTPTCPRATAGPMPGSSAPSSSSCHSSAPCGHSILEPNVINKLLDLLSDLVKSFSGIATAPTPGSLSPATKPSTSCASNPRATVVSLSPSLATTTRMSTPCIAKKATENHATNLSVNSLDEFASDLSMETAENNVDPLNFRPLTTQ